MLGSKVTATIKESIVVGEYYEDNPALLMFGMCIVLVGCAFWLIVATWFELPVSSTHTCIGGMLGMAVVSRGFKAIHWSTVINVICSWFYTPLLAGIISFSFFYSNVFKSTSTVISWYSFCTWRMTVSVTSVSGSRPMRVVV